MKALKKWVFDRNITTLCSSEEKHNIFPQHNSLMSQNMKSKYISVSWGEKLVSFDMKWTQQTSPLVLDTICPGCPTWGCSPTCPQTESLGQGWQTLQIQCLHCPLDVYSQNHSPTPARWSPRRLRSARCSSACCQASGLRARCPPPSATSPRLEEHDWFLWCNDTSFQSDSRSLKSKLLQAVIQVTCFYPRLSEQSLNFS